MLRIRWIDKDAVDDQIVSIADSCKTLPLFAAVPRLIDPTIRRAQVEMRVIPGVCRKGARGPAIWSKREPRDGVNLRANKTKDQNNPKSVKPEKSVIQRCGPIQSRILPTIQGLIDLFHVRIPAQRLTGYLPSQPSALLSVAWLLLLVRLLRWRSPRHRLHCRLVHCRCVCGGVGCAGGNQARRNCLSVVRSSVDRDA